MKKYLMIGSVVLLASAGVAATVVNTGSKETIKKQRIHKECPYKKSACMKMRSCS